MPAGRTGYLRAVTTLALEEGTFCQLLGVSQPDQQEARIEAKVKGLWKGD